MKSWGAPRNINKKLQPELLGQANIPKPLHGINPRTIMGQTAWKRLRQEIIQNNPYCKACGLDTYTLDLHEDYEIDYNNAIMRIKQYVPLCKDCHLFIHSGFLTTQIASSSISREKAREIMQHGIDICEKYDIAVFVVGYKLAKYLSVRTKNVKKWQPKNTVSWNAWELEYEGKRYKGLTQAQWKNKYNR